MKNLLSHSAIAVLKSIRDGCRRIPVNEYERGLVEELEGHGLVCEAPFRLSPDAHSLLSSEIVVDEGKFLTALEAGECFASQLCSRIAAAQTSNRLLISLAPLIILDRVHILARYLASRKVIWFYPRDGDGFFGFGKAAQRT